MKKTSKKACSLDDAPLFTWIDERFLKSFAMVQCLSLIARGHGHGYDIMKFFEKTYNVKLSAGKLYPVLQGLEDEGYIVGKWKYSRGKPGKKTYEITEKGEAFLLEVKGRLMSLVNNICLK